MLKIKKKCKNLLPVHSNIHNRILDLAMDLHTFFHRHSITIIVCLFFYGMCKCSFLIYFLPGLLGCIARARPYSLDSVFLWPHLLVNSMYWSHSFKSPLNFLKARWTSDTIVIRTLYYTKVLKCLHYSFFYPKQAMNPILNAIVSIFTSCSYSKFLHVQEETNRVIPTITMYVCMHACPHFLSVFPEHIEVHLILDGREVVLFPSRSPHQLVLMVTTTAHDHPVTNRPNINLCIMDVCSVEGSQISNHNLWSLYFISSCEKIPELSNDSNWGSIVSRFLWTTSAILNPLFHKNLRTTRLNFHLWTSTFSIGSDRRCVPLFQEVIKWGDETEKNSTLDD